MLSWDYEPKSKEHVDFTRPVKSKTEKMQQYNRIYREKHSSYVDCGCGSRYKEISKYTHQHSARHRGWIDTTK